MQFGGLRIDRTRPLEHGAALLMIAVQGLRDTEIHQRRKIIVAIEQDSAKVRPRLAPSAHRRHAASMQMARLGMARIFGQQFLADPRGCLQLTAAKSRMGALQLILRIHKKFNSIWRGQAAIACVLAYKRHKKLWLQTCKSDMPATPERIVWIASYPKSGNTWVRFMACNLLFGRQESAAALNTLVPDIHESAGPAERPTHAGVLKTHFPFGADLPFAEQTAAAIYVVRNPADVLVSNFFYSQRSAGNADPSAEDFEQYFEMFIKHRGDRRWIERGMGSWQENARSWLWGEKPFPVVRIRYEDLLQNPQQACRSMAQLLRPASSASDIEDAVGNSSFARMREVERADIREKRVGIFYKPYLQASIDSGNRFMRRGLAGDGIERLTPEQRTRLREAFAPLLQELGYASSLSSSRESISRQI